MKPLPVLAACLSLALPAAAQSVSGVPGGPRAEPTVPVMVTYVTGELPGLDVVFEVAFDRLAPFSGVVSVAVVEPGHFSLDGIDFVPGTGAKEVVVGCPIGKLTHYDVHGGAVLRDLVPMTDATAVPCAPGTWPSSVLSTPAHVYYTENQFGFGATPCHRIVRKPFGGGPEELVYDGAVHGLVNFEGLEIVAGRLYFFVKDPGAVDERALVSIGLTPFGLWDGMPFAMHVPGLFEAPGPGTDGSDELDFDPVSGLIYGTNIVNGEVIAFDPFLGVEYSSPGAVHFIDDVHVAASAGDLALLGASIDGIRSTGDGGLVFSGKGGVIGAIDIFGVMVDGPDDGDVTPLVVAPGTMAFDDLTPIVIREVRAPRAPRSM